MAKSTQSELREQIDYERREANVRFIKPEQTKNLLNRALKRILREPGIKTIPELQNIVVSNGTTRYALEEKFKELITLWSGEGSASGVEFTYLPVDDFNAVVSGYHYTFIEDGYIEIKFPDTSNLPSSNLKLRYWSKDIVLDADGTTKKRVWENDEDKSALPEEYDDFYIEWVTANILKREGKKEWKDRLATAIEILSNLKEQSGSKTRRTGRSFGHYMFGRLS